MNSSQYPGVIGQTLNGASFEAMDEELSLWLASALKFHTAMVMPSWKQDRVKAPDFKDCCFFSVGNFKRAGDYVEKESDETSTIRYNGQLEVVVRIYGPNVRSNALLLCDTFAVNQNCEVLHKKLGLGYVECTLEGPALEPVGNTFRQFADVTIVFNFSYTRTWSIRSIASENLVLHVNR